jgi:hypothetical protein
VLRQTVVAVSPQKLRLVEAVALTRGTHENTTYVFTVSPKRADSAPGPRPASELARYDRLATQPGDRSPEASQAKPADALRCSPR